MHDPAAADQWPREPASCDAARADERLKYAVIPIYTYEREIIPIARLTIQILYN